MLRTIRQKLLNPVLVKQDEIIKKIELNRLQLNPVLVKQDEIIKKIEFVSRYEIELNRLQQSLDYQVNPNYTPLEVEYDTSNEKLEKILSHIEAEWSEYGKKNTYWSVLVNEHFLDGNLNSENLSDFYNSGKDTMDFIETTLRRCSEWDVMCKEKCMEYGCGVGRVTIPLANAFDSVLGLDISPGHLAIAENYMKKNEITNINFQKIGNLKELEYLGKFDFIFNVIVLQHNPPPIMAQILRFFFTHLRSGGIVMFQIPVQMRDYKFCVDEYIEEMGNTKGMEMHMLPQNIILKIAYEYDCFLLEVHNDSWTGEFHRFISQTFVFKKK
jgi:2-polyprenyl-3-methyl-5-hydroxy-6-metoxy-1,4-benzoquinol methylase